MTHRIRKGLHKKNKEPVVPISRVETMRQYITALLEQETLSAKGISQLMRIPENDVCDHLEHIKKTLGKHNQQLITTPAQCERCGFIYRKRDRLSKPGKCPICHENLINPPRFHIVINK